MTYTVLQGARLSVLMTVYALASCDHFHTALLGDFSAPTDLCNYGSVLLSWREYCLFRMSFSDTLQTWVRFGNTSTTQISGVVPSYLWHVLVIAFIEVQYEHYMQATLQNSKPTH